MRVISKRRLRIFWESRTDEEEIARTRLLEWEQLARHSHWANFAELKQTFGSADTVGDCIVFDIGGNRFRLISRVNYRMGKLFVLKIMDHKEYDKGRWVEDCDCHEPRPKQKPKP